jgi:hypothetical protein
MERSSSRWRFMNPFEWIKALYGWLGVDYPRASLIGVIILSAVLGGAFWRFAAYIYAKDHPITVTAQPAPTTNITTGSQSPILTNNSGNVTISNDDSKPEKAQPKDKPK